MPPRQDTPERVVARVESTAHDRAWEPFCGARSTMRENQAAPRVGRDAHAADARLVEQSFFHDPAAQRVPRRP